MSTPLLLALSGVAMDGALAGEYAEVGAKQACQLQIKPDGAFAFSCPGQAPTRGTVDVWGDLLAFGITLPPSEIPLLGGSREYWAAVDQFMQQHLKDHGFYPVVAPPRPPEAPDLPTAPFPLVAVQGPRGEFLVEPTERDGFCAAATSGREPKKAKRAKGLFVRRKGGALAGIPWRAFCDAAWTPRIELPQQP